MANVPNKNAQEQEDLKKNMSGVKHKIIVLSGKGGVGKSTVAVNLAVYLSMMNNKVGLLDIDIHGPSVPKLLGLSGQLVSGTEDDRLVPIQYNENLKVISIGFLMKDEKEAIIWRGPLKYGAIKQFLKDVEWGELDYLIIDSPPGTGDEPLSIVQLLDDPEGAVVVTTPQDVALLDVKKSITFCQKLELPVLGIVENMSGFVCPHCGERVDIFKSGGGKALSEEMSVPYLGSIPLDPEIVKGCDSGNPLVLSEDTSSESSQAFTKIIENIKKAGGK